MQNSGVAEVDMLAEQMYASLDNGERQRARASLDRLTHEEADASFLFTILRESSSQYTLLFIAQSLVLWFKSTRRWMTEEQRRELLVVHCGGCLKRVFDNGAPKHVIAGLLTCYAKLTKLAFESEPFLESAVNFPLDLLEQEQVGSSSRLLSLLLLETIVVEFSKFDSSKSQTYLTFVTHRLCSSNFKETSLLKIFLAAIKQLGLLTANSPDVGEVVRLVESSLSYDFRAIMVDDTEELPIAQFPSAWKAVLLSEQNMNTLWGQHAALPSPHCIHLLTGISSVCGIHRTFFDSVEERSRYLQYTLSMLIDVTMLQDGRLKNPQYLNLLAESARRIVVSFGYRDLRALVTFEPWVSAMHRISMDVLSVPFGQEGCFSTTSTILSFWATLTISKRRFGGDENPRDLEEILPPLLECFLRARIRSPESGTNFTMDADERDSVMDSVLAQSDAYSSITLLDPVPCLNSLATYLNQCVGMSILSSPTSTGWLFYIAGSLVRVVLSGVEEEIVDACSHVFAYVTGCATHRLRRDGDREMFGSFVESGVLYLLSNMQMVLTGQRVHGSVSAVITNVFQCRSRLFQFILDNTGHNLLLGSANAETADIIRSSVEIITDACRDAPVSLLQELSFDLPPMADLPLSQSEQTYKLRTSLMKALWFLRKTGPYSRDRMLSYLSDIETSMQRTLNDGLMSPSFVAGWLRDLRGACQALNEDEEPFCDFIDWFSERVNAFHVVLSSPAAESSVVVISLLRFLCELVTPGRYGRLHVSSSSSSAVGLLLFKQLCSLLGAVEERRTTTDHIRALDGSTNAYNSVIKPWILSMDAIRKCIQGEFIPFGAMWFYHDDTFDNIVLGQLQKLTLVAPDIFKENIKFTNTSLELLHTLTEGSVYMPLSKLTSEELLSLVGAVVLICEDVETSTCALLHGLGFLSFIAGLVREVKALVLSPGLRPGMAHTPPPPLHSMQQQQQQQQQRQQQQQQQQGFYAPQHGGSATDGARASRQLSARPLRFSREAREALAQRLSPHADIWQRLLSMAMHIIIYQDRAVSACSSIVYPIFEAHPPFWFAFVEHFVSTYPERKRGPIREALSTLANAAESQEKFFSEVFPFRQTLRRLNV